MQASSALQDEPVGYDEWQRVIARNVSAELEPRVRRRHRRYAVKGEVKATYSLDGKSYKRTWRLLEVSATGLTVKSHEPLPGDVFFLMYVDMDGDPVCLRGEAVHSTQTLGGFKTGIRLQFH